MKIISRQKAKALELKYYFTGRPCKYGHIAERSVANQDCTVCHRERDRKWRRENPEAVREYARKWRRDNPGLTRYFTGKPCKRGHVCERTASRRCVICAQEQNRNWRRNQSEASREASREANRERLRRWRENNSEAHRKANREYDRKRRRRMHRAFAVLQELGLKL